MADVADGLPAASHLDFETFVATLRSAPRGGATDVLGIAYELVQGFLENMPALRSLYWFCDSLARVRFSATMYNVLSFSKLTPAKKGTKGKLRPLMCGTTFRRLTASTLCAFDTTFMATTVGEAQFAVGRSAGVEKLGFTVRALLEAFPELAVLQIDAVSAFNNINRSRVLQRLRECAPHLLAFAAVWLTNESKAVLRKADGGQSVLRICTGVDQGDPMAPFLFAIALPLPEIRERLRQLLATAAAARQSALAGALLSYLANLSTRA